MIDALIWTIAAAVVVFVGAEALDTLLNYSPAVVWHKP